MANGDIFNYSADGKMREDPSTMMNNDGSIAEVREMPIVPKAADPRVLKDPAPSVTVNHVGMSFPAL